MTDELTTFKTLFDIKPHSKKLEDKIKDYNADQFFHNLIFQCDSYSIYITQQESNKKTFPELKEKYSPTLDIHDVSKRAHYFRNALTRLKRLEERLEKKDITMHQLKEDDPVLYYRSCFELYTAIHNEKKPFEFLKF